MMATVKGRKSAELLWGATTDADGLSLDQQWVCLGAAWNWIYWMWGKLLAEATLAASPATKTLP
ncbi:unnamed protein product, partial [Bubo scandiacus]